MTELRTIQITDGEMELTNTTLVVITDAEALAQALVNRMKLYLESWFITPQSGVDWPDILNSKPVLTDRIADILKQSLRNDNRVLKIRKFEIDFTDATRTLTVRFEADTEVGLISEEVAI